jgi:hypothetical protein
VENEDLAGNATLLVVTDATGNVLAKQQLTIGEN